MILRHLDIDSRQRLVVFLNNRQMISSDRASSLVAADSLVDPELKRRDLGIKRPTGEKMHRQIFAACGIAIILVFGIGFLSSKIFQGKTLGGPSTVVAIEVEKKPAPVRAVESEKNNEILNPEYKVRDHFASHEKEASVSNRAMQPGTIKITGTKNGMTSI